MTRSPRKPYEVQSNTITALCDELEYAIECYFNGGGTHYKAAWKLCADTLAKRYEEGVDWVYDDDADGDEPSYVVINDNARTIQEREADRSADEHEAIMESFDMDTGIDPR